eukprot:3490959-Pyramimonas_sp.AAC.1
MVYVTPHLAGAALHGVVGDQHLRSVHGGRLADDSHGAQLLQVHLRAHRGAVHVRHGGGDAQVGVHHDG